MAERHRIYVQVVEAGRGGISVFGRRFEAPDEAAAYAGARAVVPLSPGALVLRDEYDVRSGELATTTVLATFGRVSEALIDRLSEAPKTRLHHRRWP